MAENKTQPTDAEVIGFLETVENELNREDSFALLNLMPEATGDAAKMWEGDSSTSISKR